MCIVWTAQILIPLLAVIIHAIRAWPTHTSLSPVEQVGQEPGLEDIVSGMMSATFNLGYDATPAVHCARHHERQSFSNCAAAAYADIQICCRCGGGPVLGGVLGDHIGFAWTAAAFGTIMVVQAAAVTMLSIVRPQSLNAAQPADTGVDKDPLLRRQIGRRMSESHDAVRGCRGGLAAPSVDLTQTLRSDSSL